MVAVAVTPSAGLRRDPLDELAGLDLKEPAQTIERIGVHPAEAPFRTGQPVGAWVSHSGTLAQCVGRNTAGMHEFVDLESDHNTFPVEPRRLHGITWRCTTLQYTGWTDAIAIAP